MIRHSLFVLLLSTLPLALVFAQDDGAAIDTASSIGRSPRNGIGLGAALSYLRSRDEGASPLAYKGVGWPFRLTYTHRGDDDRHMVAITYAKTGINAPALGSSITERADAEGGLMASHTADYSYRGLSYGYSRVLWRSDDRRAMLHAGAMWDNILFFRYYNYGYRQATEHDPSVATWDVNISLDALLGADYIIDRENRLEGTLHLPIVAWIVRPRYTIQDDELIKISLDNFSRLHSGRARVVAIGELVQLDGRLLYTRALTPAFDVGIDYHFLFFRYDEPRSTTTLRQELGMSVIWRF